MLVTPPSLYSDSELVRERDEDRKSGSGMGGGCRFEVPCVTFFCLLPPSYLLFHAIVPHFAPLACFPFSLLPL